MLMMYLQQLNKEGSGGLYVDQAGDTEALVADPWAMQYLVIYQGIHIYKQH